MQRPAIGQPNSIYTDHGTQPTPSEPFHYISFPSDALPHFYSPDARPTGLRDAQTGYNILALPTQHHPTLPATPRPDTPGLRTILHSGRPLHLVALSPANSQIIHAPDAVALRAQDAWVRTARLRVFAIANQILEQQHFEELRRRLTCTARIEDFVQAGEHAVSSSGDGASHDSNTDAEGITDNEDIEMTSLSASESTNGAGDEEAHADDTPETREADSIQKVRHRLMDDSVSDKEDMLELESSDEEAAFVQRYRKEASSPHSYPSPRLRLPLDINCESLRPPSVISPTYSHPSNCSSSSYLDSVPSLISAPEAPSIFLLQPGAATPPAPATSRPGIPLIPIRSPTGFCTINKPGFAQYMTYINQALDSPALDPNERTRDGILITAMIECRTIKLAHQHQRENQFMLRPVEHAQHVMEDRAAPFLDYSAIALGEMVQLDLYQHWLDPDASEEKHACAEDEVQDTHLSHDHPTNYLQAQVVASSLQSLSIVNPNGTTSFRDDMGVAISDDGSRIRELSHDAQLLGPMYRLAIRVLAMSRRELIAFIADLRSCMVETTDGGMALINIQHLDLDETLLHQDTHFLPPYLHGFKYARLRLIQYTFAREGDFNISNAIDRLLCYRFLEALIITHFLHAGLLDGNNMIYCNGAHIPIERWRQLTHCGKPKMSGSGQARSSRPRLLVRAARGPLALSCKSDVEHPDSPQTKAQEHSGTCHAETRSKKVLESVERLHSPETVTPRNAQPDSSD
ncbi:hypothetical protein DFH06DRAFT_1146129 [Mycena polygramma]|nr:hypothetical protein DFH06DRAFT_1146129 [Mycena polygramma]